MQIDPEEVRQRFAQLSDEGLLAIDRKDLIELAQQYYDLEMSHRGLRLTSARSEGQSEGALAHGEELVPVGTFVSFEEASLSRAMLESAGIAAKLENEVSSHWAGLGGLRLMVPASLLNEAQEILESTVSDEELLAQAEAAERDEDLESNSD